MCVLCVFVKCIQDVVFRHVGENQSSVSGHGSYLFERSLAPYRRSYLRALSTRWIFLSADTQPEKSGAGCCVI